MKMFQERNPLILCVAGVALTIGVTAVALNYDKVPFVNQNKHYSAYFAESGGLISGASVEVSGYRVGQVERLSLEGSKVLVEFNVDEGVHLGDRTEAAIKTKTLLGAKLLEITPRGDGRQAGPIPVERTHPPYQLPDALGDLTSTISGLNTDQLSQSLAVLSDTFKDTPPALKLAINEVGRFSQTLDNRDAALRDLLSNADKVTGVLADESDKVVALVANTNALLSQLQDQSTALDHISTNIAAAARQLKGFIEESRETLKPALDKLNGVLEILDKHKAQIQQSIKKLNAYSLSLGEAVAGGPFFNLYLANLLPGQFIQPYVDAAFSDLGLDPHTLLPSQLSDPQVGQPGTPALPVPYPRTGQGGEPHLSLPDAITGKPDDARYPYREPLPAPPPGGPPPGPPAATEPKPSPVFVPVPNEAPIPGTGQ